ERLDLDVDDIPICLACLSFVSSALESGHPREIDRTVAEFAPSLWEEGLAQPVLLAQQRPKRQGMAGAEAALAEVERRGARAPIVASSYSASPLSFLSGLRPISAGSASSPGRRRTAQSFDACKLLA